jgi:hypothetical protein
VNRIETPHELQALCRLAGEQATGTLEGRTAPRGGFGALLSGKRLLTLGLLGGASLFAAAVMEGQLRLQASPEPMPPSPAAVLQPPTATPPPVPAAPTNAAPVRWKDGDLLVDFEQVTLYEAVALLASATGSVVQDAELLPRSTPVTVHLRVRYVGEAWTRLLQGRAEFNSACTVTGCQVSIVHQGGGPAAAATAQTNPALPEMDAAPAQPPTEQEISQPGGSC